jgi:hypothetical protein
MIEVSGRGQRRSSALSSRDRSPRYRSDGLTLSGARCKPGLTAAQHWNPTQYPFYGNPGIARCGASCHLSPSALCLFMRPTVYWREISRQILLRQLQRATFSARRDLSLTGSQPNALSRRHASPVPRDQIHQP